MTPISDVRAWVNRKEVSCTVNGNVVTLDIPPGLKLDIPPGLKKRKKVIRIIYPYKPEWLYGEIVGIDIEHPFG